MMFVGLVVISAAPSPSQVPYAGVPSKDEMRMLFSGALTDNETRRMVEISEKLGQSGPEILPDLLSLYRQFIDQRDSLVPANCSGHILRLAKGPLAATTMNTLLQMKSVRAHVLALRIATANDLPAAEWRSVAKNIFQRHEEFTAETGFSAIELYMALERYCQREDLPAIAELLSQSDSGRLDIRKHGAALLARIGNEDSLATLKSLHARWQQTDTSRIQKELRDRKMFAEEGGDVWDPKSPAATKGLREDWLNSIGTSISNLESRLKSEGRLPAAPK